MFNIIFSFINLSNFDLIRNLSTGFTGNDTSQRDLLSEYNKYGRLSLYDAEFSDHVIL